jgi:hypothetical protein
MKFTDKIKRNLLKGDVEISRANGGTWLTASKDMTITHEGDRWNLKLKLIKRLDGCSKGIVYTDEDLVVEQRVLHYENSSGGTLYTLESFSNEFGISLMELCESFDLLDSYIGFTEEDLANLSADRVRAISEFQKAYHPEIY